MIVPDRARLVSVAEMREIERAADAAGHSYAAMMDLAGAATARALPARFGPLPALVLVGPGNNGGDGLVCARVLHAAGCPVRLYLWQRRTEPGQDYEGHFAAAAALGIEHARADADPGFATLRSWLAGSRIVVDALLGTGANRPIAGGLAALLETVRAHLAAPDGPRPVVVAVDCPSGLNCDTGAADPLTLRAELTVTFAYAKQGHYRFPGAALVGELEVADIGTPPALGERLRTFVLDGEMLAPLLPPRPAASHKGTFGKLLAAGGSVNYPGAITLNLAAAGRVGTGLVTGAVPAPVWPVAASRLAEPTWVVLPAQGVSVAGEAAGLLGAAARSYDALLLGCGLTQQPGAVAFVAGVLAGGDLPPTVLDADGLNCWAQLSPRPPLPAQTVLTPHPAEMARLCGATVAEVQAQAWENARDRAAAWNAVVLLKGPYTVIAAPGGELAVLPVATPALATGGSGDVLAGAIGGLLAQGVPPFDAACLGAWLHGAAGRLCETEIGLAGTVAADLIERLPPAIAALRAPAQRAA